MQPSGWTWGTRKRDLDAAHWWGIIPSRFYSLDRDDRLDILALYESHWRIEAVNSWEANEKAKRESKKRRPKK